MCHTHNGRVPLILDLRWVCRNLGLLNTPSFSSGTMPEVKTEHQDAQPATGVVKPKAKAKPEKVKKEKVMDYTLASLLEECRAARHNIRDTGNIIRWPSKETENIPSLEVVGLNSTILQVIADFHCSKVKQLKAPRINFLKAQVGVGKPKKHAPCMLKHFGS